MIPKIIHYCWFGEASLTELAEKCITSWKKHCPDYKLMIWNETNFDVNIVPFTAQVAKVKKWGFIVDYIRAYVVYNYGGIYLDTDVELLKSFSDDMLQNICFSGFENEKYINPGNIFAGEKECAIAKELMDFYASYNFINENGELNLTPSPRIFTDILLKYGLRQNNNYQELGIFTAYPTEYFCPKDFRTGFLEITENTCSIHHYDSSWLSSKEKKYFNIMQKMYNKLGNNILSRIFGLFLFFIMRLEENGFFPTIKWYYNYLLNLSKNKH
jgi:mannosyltransferase OCH1-like enzyme